MMHRENPHLQRLQRQQSWQTNPRTRRRMWQLLGVLALFLGATALIDIEITTSALLFLACCPMWLALALPIMAAGQASSETLQDITAASYELVYLTALSDQQLAQGYYRIALWRMRLWTDLLAILWGGGMLILGVAVLRDADALPVLFFMLVGAVLWYGLFRMIVALAVTQAIGLRSQLTLNFTQPCLTSFIFFGSTCCFCSVLGQAAELSDTIYVLIGSLLLGSTMLSLPYLAVRGLVRLAARWVRRPIYQ